MIIEYYLEAVLSTDHRDNVKLAIILRAVRAMLRLNLKEMGELLRYGSSTVGKFESAELELRAGSYIRFMKHINELGIDIQIDPVVPDHADSEYEIVIKVSKKFVEADLKKLEQKLYPGRDPILKQFFESPDE